MTRQAISKLPLAALRLSADDVTALAKLGLRRVEDILGVPRATLSRRFGQGVVRRLDQALGIEAEPVGGAEPAPRFSVRLTFPEPIGLRDDVLAGIDRLLPPLCEKLKVKGQGARSLRFQIFRADETSQSVDVGLARPSHDPARIKPLLSMKVDDLDAGFGIDMMRLDVLSHEAVQAVQHSGHIQSGQRAIAGTHVLDDLIGRIGARIDLEEITWMHPASSHIPEKAFMPMAAAWAEPVAQWPEGGPPRPNVIFTPELVTAADTPFPPDRFRWRGQDLHRSLAVGPERISPEWWLDEPAWRTGVRDYWRVDVEGGMRLWMYYAHGATMSGGWFCHGRFE